MGTFSGNAFDSGTFDVYVPLGWDVDTVPRPRRRRQVIDPNTAISPPAPRRSVTTDQSTTSASRPPRRRPDLPDPYRPQPHYPASDQTDATRARSPRQQPEQWASSASRSKISPVAELTDSSTRPKPRKTSTSGDDGTANPPHRPIPDEHQSLHNRRQKPRSAATTDDVPPPPPVRAVYSGDVPTPRRRRTASNLRDDSPAAAVSPPRLGPPDLSMQQPRQKKKLPEAQASAAPPLNLRVVPSQPDDLRPRGIAIRPSQEVSAATPRPTSPAAEEPPKPHAARRGSKIAPPDDVPARKIIIQVDSVRGAEIRPRRARTPTDTEISTAETRPTPFVPTADFHRARRTTRKDHAHEPAVIVPSGYSQLWIDRLPTPRRPLPTDSVETLRGLIAKLAPHDDPQPIRWRPYRAKDVVDVLRPHTPYPPWEETDSRAKTRKIAVPAEHVLVRSDPPIMIPPWGFEPTVAPRWSRPRVFVSDVVVLVPLIGPSPVPNLPINVFIGGGTPRTEIVAGPSVEDLEEYYEDLVERSARLRGVTPDVLGREEYERERERRWTESLRPEPTRQTTCRFEPTLTPENYRRVVMLVGDARSRGLTVSETDAFTLRYRLHKFSTDLELKMVGGCVVKLATSRPADLVALARLSRLHLYELVTWTRDAIFVFDDTTLTPKVPPVAWWALGAGWGLALGAELWRAPEPPEIDLLPPKRSRKRSRRGRH